MALDTSALTKEVGVGKLQLPIGLWLVAGAAGIWLARKGIHLGGTTPTTPTDATSAAGGSLLPTVGPGGAVNITPGGAFDSGTSSKITDNDAWRVAAIDYLSKNGYNALAASTGVTKYLAGERLTTPEGIMVDAALTKLGPTPEPVTLPIGSDPTPPTPTPTALQGQWALLGQLYGRIRDWRPGTAINTADTIQHQIDVLSNIVNHLPGATGTAAPRSDTIDHQLAVLQNRINHLPPPT